VSETQGTGRGELSDTEHLSQTDREKSLSERDAVHTTMDRRSERTRQALHQTLMRLIVERGYDELSVSDIVDAANVGRSTFYSHFTDKDDLLRGMAGTLRTILVAQHAIMAAGATSPDSRVLGFTRFMTQHLKDQRVLYQALMGSRAGPMVLDSIRHGLCDIVRKELPSDPPSAGLPNREFTVQFLVGAYLSVLTWWLDGGAKDEACDIEAAFRELAARCLGKPK
jgi:AcrR family transcriptional regulator